MNLKVLIPLGAVFLVGSLSAGSLGQGGTGRGNSNSNKTESPGSKSRGSSSRTAPAKPASVNSDNAPSLKETLRFIEGKIEAYGAWSNTVKGETESHVYRFEQVSGCRVQLSDKYTAPPSSTYIQSRLEDYSFSLSDLDPASIKVEFPETIGLPFITIETLNSQNSVVVKRTWYSNIKPDSITERNSDEARSINFILGNKDEATRVINAFQHAIKLCGGKPSKF